MDIGLIVHAIIAFIFVIGFAYLIWAAGAKAEGVLKSVGSVLALAIAAIGILCLVGMLSAPMFGGRPFGLDMHHAGGPAAVSGEQAANGDADSAAAAPGGEQSGKPAGDAPPKP